jgi:hypothetical protein
MCQSKFTETQIANFLEETDAGHPSLDRAVYTLRSRGENRKSDGLLLFIVLESQIELDIIKLNWTRFAVPKKVRAGQKP